MMLPRDEVLIERLVLVAGGMVAVLAVSVGMWLLGLLP